MTWLRWVSGRQNPYYDKLLLFKIPHFMDCWLIRYAKAVGIGWHTDKVEGKKHYRLNIVLRNKNASFWINHTPCDKRVLFFRPDKDTHSVKVIGSDAYRLVLSIGWVI